MSELTWNAVCRQAKVGNPDPPRVVEKTDQEWRAQLTGDQYYVTRQSGTERPFSSSMCELHAPGRYRCVCCDEELFDSSTKFDSGTGWPSFTGPVTDNVIRYLMDESHGMVRVETRCNVCDAHLGHVFPKDAAGSELRFCINGLALAKAE